MEEDKKTVTLDETENKILPSLEEKNLAVEDKVETDDDKSFGKFKTADELLRGYNELEKEFTKKSQRLKDMERVETKIVDVPFEEMVEKFFSENEDAKPYSKDMALYLEKNPALLKDKNCLDVALSKVLLSQKIEKEDLAKDKDFLNDYIFSNIEIKDKIIEDYLSSLSTPPQVIKSGMAYMSPPDRPKTIEEAGRMMRNLDK